MPDRPVYPAISSGGWQTLCATCDCCTVADCADGLCRFEGFCSCTKDEAFGAREADHYVPRHLRLRRFLNVLNDPEARALAGTRPELGDVLLAVEYCITAEFELAKAVSTARRAGVSWPKLSKLLGTTRQAVRYRYMDNGGH